MVIFGPWGLETPEQIQLKFGVFDYVHRLTPHAKYGSRQRGGVIILVKFYPACFFH